MVKFNNIKKPEVVRTYEGGKAVKYSGDKDKLTMQVVNNMFGEPTFYPKSNSELVELIKKVGSKDPDFVLKLAKFTRNELHMRTISNFVIVVLTNECKHIDGIRNKIADIIERPDDMTEMIACQLKLYGKPIPAALKYGISKGFTKFNTYQLAKYKNDRSEVTLRDVMFLTHPKPKNTEMVEVYAKLAEQTLEAPETWEVIISGGGSTYENWKEIIPKMGHMAMLRNLNNFTKVGITPSEVEYKFTKESVIKGKQLPFRYFTAYDNASSEFRPIIQKCMDWSIENATEIKGKTAILVDVSGSMSWCSIAGKSSVTPRRIASVLASMLYMKSNSIIVPFATTAGIYVPSEEKTMMDMVNKIESLDYGGGTNVNAGLNIISNIEDIDNIIILSDMQMMNSNYIPIRKDVNVYSVDLCRYGTTIFGNAPNVYTIGGWSEKLIDFIALNESGHSMSKIIENYNPK